jgi:hypothetical protein
MRIYSFYRNSRKMVARTEDINKEHKKLEGILSANKSEGITCTHGVLSVDY